MMEIHEVVDKDGAMVMQPKEGGLVVPAGGSAELKPGSDHLMLMKLPAPIEAGDEVEITVVCDTGGSVTWTSVAKPFEGGAESYVPAEGSMDVHVAEPVGELTPADGPRPAARAAPGRGHPSGAARCAGPRGRRAGRRGRCRVRGRLGGGPRGR